MKPFRERRRWRFGKRAHKRRSEVFGRHAPRASPAFAKATARQAETRLQGEHECLADFAQSNAPRSFTQCRFETLNWFAERLKTKSEGLMVHRHDETGTCGIGHLDCLLRRAVGLDPGIVSANRHDRHVDRAMSPQLCEILRHCGITSENYPASASSDQVSIVAAVRVP